MKNTIKDLKKELSSLGKKEQEHLLTLFFKKIKKYKKLAFMKKEAADPTTSQERLCELAISSNPVIRRLVAQNPNIPLLIPYFSQLIVNFPNEVMNNPIIATAELEDPGFFEKLLLPVDKKYLAGFSKNERITNYLASSMDGNVLLELSNNVNLTIKAIEQLSQHDNWQIRKNIANRLRTPIHILKQLAEDPVLEVRTDVIFNPNITIEILEYIEKNDEDGDNRKYASNTLATRRKNT